MTSEEEAALSATMDVIGAAMDDLAGIIGIANTALSAIAMQGALPGASKVAKRTGRMAAEALQEIGARMSNLAGGADLDGAIAAMEGAFRGPAS